MNAKSYFDLCIPEKHFTKENCFTTLDYLRRNGYRTVAINQEVREGPEPSNENKKKKKKGAPKKNNELVPEPFKIDENILKDFGDMTILNRLTICFSDRDFYYKLSKSTNLKKYDILAVLPKTKLAFMFTCTSIDADIITYDAEERLPYRVERNVYNHLVKKGFFFEILYGPTIEDSSKRDNTIFLAHMYHSIGKSRAIIVSSGISKLVYLRSAYDVINLGLLFGLNMQQSKDALSHCGLQLCKKAVGRCHGKSIVMVETVSVDDTNISIVEIDDSEVEMIEVDEPESKRRKNNSYEGPLGENK